MGRQIGAVDPFKMMIFIRDVFIRLVLMGMLQIYRGYYVQNCFKQKGRFGVGS